MKRNKFYYFIFIIVLLFAISSCKSSADNSAELKQETFSNGALVEDASDAGVSETRGSMSAESSAEASNKQSSISDESSAGKKTSVNSAKSTTTAAETVSESSKANASELLTIGTNRSESSNGPSSRQTTQQTSYAFSNQPSSEPTVQQTAGQTASAASHKQTPQTSAVSNPIKSSAETSPKTTPTTQATSVPAETKPEFIQVYLSVDCSVAVEAGDELAIAVSDNGTIMSNTEFTLENGATVYDLIMDSGLVIGAQGGYISSIQSLSEFGVKGKGGWHYFVNGVNPGFGVSQYVLEQGDQVRFEYTLDY